MLRLILLSFLLASMVLAGATKKPDFSGEWHLNLERCDFANSAAPKKITEKISHKEPSLTVDVLEVSPLEQEVKQSLKYTTDGKEVENTISGSVVKGNAKWAGEELVVQWSSEFGGRKVSMQETWKLGEGGTTLFVSRHLEGFAGKIEQSLVFDKEWVRK